MQDGYGILLRTVIAFDLVVLRVGVITTVFPS